ncbi:MAG TPA: PQQ-dependent sugar dehydrogenase [Hyphomicrobiaceae bacterium]|nr:PQQ-dependent sugar dehydrogenase [Hyphomicrobiaceae bacterium]
MRELGAMGRRTLRALALPISVAVATPLAAAITEAPPVKTRQAIKAETFAKGLVNPWGMAFLPDGRLLVTERPGRLRLVATSGSLSPPLQGVPRVAASGQGGLLDVALAPDFADSGVVYLSYAEPREGSRNGTSLARARLVQEGSGGRLEDVQVIFRQEPSYASSYHFGSRIVFMPDGSLFVTLGERNFARNEAQNPTNHLGKLVRIMPDGSPFAGNAKTPGWRPEIWSIGHRNVQGAALNPATGKLWIIDHGARGGDEINIPEAGRNYGWPVITYGRDYSGARIGEGTQKAGLEQPIYYWDPSIAPSGAAFYTADLVPEWKGSLFVGALAGQALHRLVLDGDAIVGEEALLGDLGERIRDVRQGPDGAIWVLTDSPEGRVLRVAPR